MTNDKRKACLRGNVPKTRRDDTKSFPIVGIGASAGGLMALELMLSCAPRDVPMAFVVIQHLDPAYEDSLVSLLQKSTHLPIIQIAHKQTVRQGHVYVLPHNHGVEIHDGILCLTELTKTNGLHLPIDNFLETLAKEKGRESIGIILSGMGHDGTKGFQAIKSANGLTFAQTPETAKFTSMPESVIRAGLVDGVLPPERLIEDILKKHFHSEKKQKIMKFINGMPKNGFLKKIMKILEDHTHYDFSGYKPSTLTRRVHRRMELHKLPDMAAYASYLKDNATEAHLLFKEILIGVTAFFRDPAVWQDLMMQVIPSLLAQHPAGGVLRAWVAGCATGEEAYSLAIAFCECIRRLQPDASYELKIFATDIDEDAIGFCRKGIYPKGIADAVSAELLQRYFQTSASGYKVNQSVRDMIVFAPQNVIMDSAFAKLDFVSCRNLLIYLNNTLQKKILNIFHFSLNMDGVLVLGTSESIGDLRDLFVPISGNLQIFRKIKSAQSQWNLEILKNNPTHEKPRAEFKLKEKADHLRDAVGEYLLQHVADPALLTNEQGDLVYIHGKTGDYLEPAVGKVNMNVFAMAREALTGILTMTFASALKERKKVTAHGIYIGEKNQDFRVDLTVQPITDPGPLSGLMLIIFRRLHDEESLTYFEAQNDESHAGERDHSFKQSLAQKEAEILALRSEMRRYQQEYGSVNEELQSTNEELQATNEELTTSKEEMQSMNEELQTVNQELMAKVDDLSHTRDDMVNLLNSTDIATLFLDETLCVRRFTEEATNIIRLRAGDAGRPISDLVINLEYPEMIDDIRYVLEHRDLKQREVKGHNGEWFNVCIKPYQTGGHNYDGAVITFANITKLKTVQETLENKETVFKENLSGLSLVIAKAKLDLRYTWVLSTNAEYKDVFLTGKQDLEIFGEQPGAHALNTLKKKCINECQYAQEMISLDFQGKEERFDIAITPSVDDQGAVIGVNMFAIATNMASGASDESKTLA